MKTVYRTSVLVAAMLLAACQPKPEPQDAQDPASDPTVVQQPAEPTLRGETVEVQVSMPACEGNTCPKFIVERLQSNFPFIDQLLEKEILAQLGQMLDLIDVEATASTAPTPQSKQNLDSQTQLYANAVVQLDQELKRLSSSHEINLLISPKILQAEGNLTTVVLNSSSYLGGAHGSNAQRYYNFDLTRQKQVQLQDLLKPKQKANLEKLAHEAFKTWVVDTKLATDPAQYEQAWPFKMTDNYLLSEQGLILQYAEYEIGPYVVGLPRLMIPFEQLQDILKPEYLPKPKVDAPATSVPVANTSA